MNELTMDQKRLLSRVSIVSPELMTILREYNDYEGLVDDVQRLLANLDSLYRILKPISGDMYFNLDKFIEDYLKNWR